MAITAIQHHLFENRNSNWCSNRLKLIIQKKKNEV